MQSLLLVSFIFAVGYLLSRPVFSTRWSLFGFRHLVLSGLEFLLVGFLLGPVAFKWALRRSGEAEAKLPGEA